MIYTQRMNRIRAWERTGLSVQGAETTEEALVQANLNFEVVKRPVQYFTTSTDQTLVMPNNFVTVRSDNYRSLGIVSDGYQLIQNKEIFSFLDELVKSGDAQFEHAGSIGNGERIFMTLKFDGDINVGNGESNPDVIQKYITATTTHDGSGTLKIYITPIRVWCENLLTVSWKSKISGISIRHSGNVENKLAQARQVLGLANKWYTDFENYIQRFAQRQLSHAEARDYFCKLVYGSPHAGVTDDQKKSSRLKNQFDDLAFLWGNGAGNGSFALDNTVDSLWTAYNAVTEYVDHYKTVKGSKKDPTKRVNSLMFESGARLKAKAYEEAVMLV